MVLATMLATDEDSLICDFAQYYTVYDYKSLPVNTVATLAVGLPEDSRIMRQISGQKISKTELMLAAIYDRFNAYMYSMTSDAKYGINAPESVVTMWTADADRGNQIQSYFSIDDYEKAKLKILGGE